MTKRRTITARMARDIILRQLQSGMYGTRKVEGSLDAAFVSCPLCLRKIEPGTKTIWEHLQAIGRDGPDEEENIRLVHKECADKKTRGSGATTSGSDIGEIAKTKRMEKARDALANGVPKRAKKKIQGPKKIAQPNDPWNKSFRKQIKDKSK